MIVWDAPFAAGTPSDWVTVADHVATTTLIGGFGAFYSFHKTDESVRDQFIQMLVPVAFVTAIRISLAALPLLAIGFYAAFTFAPDASNGVLEIVGSAFMFALQATYWCLVGQLLSRVVRLPAD